MGTQPTISLCIVTRNSAATLTDCLESVKALVHEIIVVDTMPGGSTDNTKEILKKYKATIIGVPQKEDELDFSAARNKGLAKATKDWILVLNPDEIISEKDHNKINTLVGHKTGDAYAFVIKTYNNEHGTPFDAESLEPVLLKHAQKFHHCIDASIIRLFKNNPGYRFRYPVFETMEDTLVKKKALIGSVQIPIHCFPTLTKEEQDEQAQTWLTILEKKIPTLSDDPKPFFDMASLYEDLGEDHKAHDLYLKAAEVDKGKQFGSNTSLYYRIAVFFIHHNQMEEAEEWLRKSMVHNLGFKPSYVALATMFIQAGNARSGLQVLVQALKNNLGDVQILNLIGFGLLQDNKTDDAIKMLERAKNISEKHNELEFIDLIYNNLFTAQTIKGDGEAAIALLEEGIAKYPRTLTFYTNLINFFAKTKQTGKALAWGQRALELNLEPEMRKHIEDSMAKLKSV